MLKIMKYDQKEGQVYSENGLIHINSSKPEFGSIMVKSTPTFRKGSVGAFGLETRTAFYVDRVKNLQMLDLKEGMAFDEVVGESLKIIRLEQTTPADGFRELINPTTGEVVIAKDGTPVYWCTKIVEASSTEADIIVEKATVTEVATAQVVKAEAALAE